MSRIYIASSWRNNWYDGLVESLLNQGHDVHDWRSPRTAFKWQQVGLEPVLSKSDIYEQPGPHQIRTVLSQHPRASQAYLSDMRGLDWCDICILLHPSGRSAHLEFGYAMGRGKHGIAFLFPDEEPDLMILMADHIVINHTELYEYLGTGDRYPSRGFRRP